MHRQHLFCFGLGYSARALAGQLIANGWRVSGTCRSEDRIAALRADGISAYLFDDDTPLVDVPRALDGVTHVLSSVPPGERGDPVLATQGAELSAVSAQLRWVGYLSTIGVYGDHQGRWIDEHCPPAPSSARGRRRVDAENGWLAFGRQGGVPVHIFRLPGIYGPRGRNQIDAVREGRARRIVKAGQVFNRIHVDDLARVLMASMAVPGGSKIYNVVDDEPAAADRVVAHAAELLGVDAPPEEPFDAAELSPFARLFYADCKRVRNDRIKQELGVELLYPTYREGLAAIARMES